MSEPFSYSTSFTLDKAHFRECFDQSVTIDTSINAYRKALAFVVVGLLILLFTDYEPYLASFIVGLGVVEALSVKYQRAWWVTRQMLGRSSNSTINLTLDETGITTQSALVNFTLNWQDISAIEKTELGTVSDQRWTKALYFGKCFVRASVIFCVE